MPGASDGNRQDVVINLRVAADPGNAKTFAAIGKDIEALNSRLAATAVTAATQATASMQKYVQDQVRAIETAMQKMVTAVSNGWQSANVANRSGIDKMTADISKAAAAKSGSREGEGAKKEGGPFGQLKEAVQKELWDRTGKGLVETILGESKKKESPTPPAESRGIHGPLAKYITSVVNRKADTAEPASIFSKDIFIEVKRKLEDLGLTSGAVVKRLSALAAPAAAVAGAMALLQWGAVGLGHALGILGPKTDSLIGAFQGLAEATEAAEKSEKKTQQMQAARDAKNELERQMEDETRTAAGLRSEFRDTARNRAVAIGQERPFDKEGLAEARRKVADAEKEIQAQRKRTLTTLKPVDVPDEGAHWWGPKFGQGGYISKFFNWALGNKPEQPLTGGVEAAGPVNLQPKIEALKELRGYQQSIAEAERQRVESLKDQLAQQREQIQLAAKLVEEEKKRFESRKADFGRLSAEDQNRITQIGLSIKAGKKLSEGDARFLDEKGYGRSLTDKFFGSRIGADQIAALTALGENGEPGASAALAEAKRQEQEASKNLTAAIAQQTETWNQLLNTVKQITELEAERAKVKVDLTTPTTNASGDTVPLGQARPKADAPTEAAKTDYQAILNRSADTVARGIEHDIVAAIIEHDKRTREAISRAAARINAAGGGL